MCLHAPGVAELGAAPGFPRAVAQRALCRARDAAARRPTRRDARGRGARPADGREPHRAVPPARHAAHARAARRDRSSSRRSAKRPTASTASSSISASSGALAGVRAVLLGSFHVPPTARAFPGDRDVDAVLRDHLLPLEVPVVRGIPAGHGPGSGRFRSEAPRRSTRAAGLVTFDPRPAPLPSKQGLNGWSGGSASTSPTTGPRTRAGRSSPASRTVQGVVEAGSVPASRRTAASRVRGGRPHRQRRARARARSRTPGRRRGYDDARLDAGPRPHAPRGCAAAPGADGRPSFHAQHDAQVEDVPVSASDTIDDGRSRRRRRYALAFPRAVDEAALDAALARSRHAGLVGIRRQRVPGRRSRAHDHRGAPRRAPAQSSRRSCSPPTGSSRTWCATSSGRSSRSGRLRMEPERIEEVLDDAAIGGAPDRPRLPRACA